MINCLAATLMKILLVSRNGLPMSSLMSNITNSVGKMNLSSFNVMFSISPLEKMHDLLVNYNFMVVGFTSLRPNLL